MKKNYRAPEMDMYAIEMAHMVANTTPSTTDNPATPEGGSDAKRRGSIFSDEDSYSHRTSIW